MRATSPAFHIDVIKIPILLIHRTEDESVFYSQSDDMQKLLNKSGRKTTLLKLKNESHGGFDDSTSMVVLSTIGNFLWDNLGPGYNVTERR